VTTVLFFGIWVYYDDLQIKFTLRSGPMIFGRVMALGLWNLAKLSPLYFTMIWDIDLIFGMWVQIWLVCFKFNFYFLGGGHFKYLYLCGGTPKKIIKILVVVPQIIDGVPTPPGIFSWKNPYTTVFESYKYLFNCKFQLKHYGHQVHCVDYQPIFLWMVKHNR
jgi:hypothetical protein